MPGFSVDTKLFRELGELLVGRESTALIELVKNAYDADATEVSIFGDPWALAEAECSLDLIQAELAAARAGPASEARTRTVAHLDAWRLRIERVVRNLQVL